MGRKAKYEDVHGRQKAYYQTPKGKEALKKAQSSENGKRIKREWWQRNRAKTASARTADFIDTYGNPNAALKLLTLTERKVISLYYGLGEQKPVSISAIASQWEKTPARIYQIKKLAEKKLSSLQKELESSE